MKLKNSIRKKILPSLLIVTTLGGVTNTTVFALDNLRNTNSVSEVSMMSKEESQKILDQMSRTRGVVKEYRVGNTDYVLIQYGGHLYLFDSGTRQLITGLVNLSGDMYYFSHRDGTAQKGWYNVTDSSNGGNGRYYFRDDTYTAYRDCFQIIHGERFHFNTYGRVDMGLFRVGDNVYYGKNKTGVIVTGWNTIGGKRYFFDPMWLGAAKRGWYQDGNAGKMYFNEDGSMASGINNINGDTYLLRPHGNGKNCYVTNGFFTDKSTGKRYLFAGHNGEALKNQWYQDVYAASKPSKGMMYFGSDGAMVTGWQTIDGKKYLFEKGSGTVNYYPKVGWYNDGYLGYGYTYYFDENDKGAATVGRKFINGVEYIFTNEGILLGNGNEYPIA